MAINPAASQNAMRTAYAASDKPTAQDKVNEKIPTKDNTTDEIKKEDHFLGDKATNSLNSGNNISIDPFLEDIQKNQDLQKDAIQKLIDKNTNTLGVYEDFDSKLKEFLKLSEGLLFSNNNTAKNVAVSKDSDAFNLELSSRAPSGKFSLEVDQVATNHQLQSHALPGLKEKLGDPTRDTRTLRITLANNTIINIQLKTNQTSPLEISKAIAAATKQGVTSRVIQSTDTESYLTISSTETGEKASIASIKVIGDDQLNAKLEYTAPPASASATGMTTLMDAQNAEFKIDGVPVIRQSNIVEDAVEGIKITLRNKTDAGEPITITIDQDNQKFMEDVRTWIGKYNELKILQNKATRISADPDKAGVLGYRNPLTDIMNSLGNIMDMQLGNGKITSLSDVRIGKVYDRSNPKDPNNTNGALDIKDEDAEEYLKRVQNNMADFKQFLIGNDDHPGLTGKIKEAINNEFSHRGGRGSALEQTQNNLKTEIKKLETKIETITETTETKINKLKIQFARLQEVMTRFNDATDYFKLMTGSKD